MLEDQKFNKYDVDKRKCQMCYKSPPSTYIPLSLFYLSLKGLPLRWCIFKSVIKIKIYIQVISIYMLPLGLKKRHEVRLGEVHATHLILIIIKVGWHGTPQPCKNM